MALVRARELGFLGILFCTIFLIPTLMKNSNTMQVRIVRLAGWFLNLLLLVGAGLGIYLGYKGEWWMIAKGVISFFVFPKIYATLILMPIMSTTVRSIKRTGGNTLTRAQMLPGLIVTYAFATLIIWGGLELLTQGVEGQLRAYAQAWLILSFFGGSLGDFFSEFNEEHLEASSIPSLLYDIFTGLAGAAAVVTGIFGLTTLPTLLIMFGTSLLLIPYHTGLHLKIDPPPGE